MWLAVLFALESLWCSELTLSLFPSWCVLHRTGAFFQLVVVAVVRYDVFFFFFSSRRRHTRLQGDWSSDVCSSDLVPLPVAAQRLLRQRRRRPGELPAQPGELVRIRRRDRPPRGAGIRHPPEQQGVVVTDRERLFRPRRRLEGRLDRCDPRHPAHHCGLRAQLAVQLRGTRCGAASRSGLRSHTTSCWELPCRSRNASCKSWSPQE